MTRTYTRIGQLVIVLLGFALRVYRLDYQELRGDEVFGYLFSLRPWSNIVAATVELQEPHPVGSYFVAKGWLASAGHSEFALRFLSVWFSVLAIVLLWRLGRALRLDPAVALAAMALMAVSPYAIWHAQDARMYSMSLALTTASSWLLIAWLSSDKAQRWWIAAAYIGVSLLALHTHYFAAFVLVAHYLFVMGLGILRRAWRRIVLPWLLIEAAIGLLYLPWFLRAAATLTGYGGNGDSPGLTAMAQRALSVFAVGESMPADRHLTLAIIAGLLLTIGTLRLLRNQRGEAAAFLLLYLLVPVGATWLSAQQRPIFDERYLVAGLPPFLLLIGAIFQSSALTDHLRPRYPALRATSYVLLGILLASGVLALSDYYTDPAYSKTRGWRELAVALDELSAGLPPDAVRVAQNFPDPTLWYYFDAESADAESADAESADAESADNENDVASGDHVVLPPQAQDVAGAQRTVDALAAQDIRRVLLPVQPAPNWDDGDIARRALDSRYELLLERQVGVWPLAVYVAPPADMTPLSTAAAWVNGITLAGIALEPSELGPNGALAAWLQWQDRAASLSGTEKVFVQLLGPDGAVVAQRDLPLAAGTLGAPQLYGLALPAALPPGAYQLIAGIYDPGLATADGGVPRVPLAAGGDYAVLQEWVLQE